VSSSESDCLLGRPSPVAGMQNDTATLLPGATARSAWAGLAGVIATLTVFAVAQGLSYPLLSFVLRRGAATAATIGLSAAMTPLGIITSAFLVPLLTRRFGARTTALACAGLAGVLFAAIGWTHNLAAWFPLRFLFGVAIGPLYVLSEVWLMALAPPNLRGRLMGLYATIASAGFALGPLSLVLVGSEGWPPCLVGVGAFATCCLCLTVTLPYLPRLDEGDQRLPSGASCLMPLCCSLPCLSPQALSRPLCRCCRSMVLATAWMSRASRPC